MLIKAETGLCRAAIPKYYFDHKSGLCKEFNWGGCGGVVPFKTNSECRNMCINDNNSEYMENLEKSLLVWSDYKSKNGNSYQYSTDFLSWVGFGSKTTIIVNDDSVVRRIYRSWDRDGNEISQWVESTSTKLGTNKEGAPLKIIEELYDECREMLLTKDSEKNSISLDFDKKGMIKNCLFSPKNCADDCSSGVRINSLSFQK